MLPNRSIPASTVIPVLVYPDVRAAVAWLTAAFGFVERVRIGEAHRAQMRVGTDGAVIVADVRGERQPPEPGRVTHVIKVRVADVEAQFERARVHGARIVQEPTEFEYGERECSVEDLAGHRWQFTQTVRDVAPEEWGGETVEHEEASERPPRARSHRREDWESVNEAEKDSIELLQRALDQTAEILAAIRPERASWPTPCSGWVVEDLVRHVVGQSLRNFIVAARGETPDWQAPAEDPGDDWAGSFREKALQLLDTWGRADPDQPVPMPGGSQAPLRSRADHQITELAVHGWDLARATGQTRELDPEVAEHALAWARRMLRPEFRGSGKAFGTEVAVDEGAPVYDRLAAWFGRDPTWQPGEE